MTDVQELNGSHPLPAPVVAKSNSMLSMIEQLMLNPDVSIERFNQAFEFYKKVEADAARKEFSADLIAAQAEMEPVRKDAHNPQTKSRYATFDALDRAIRPIYTKYGFAPTYHIEPSDKPEHIQVVLVLIHRSGHERHYSADMPADGKGAKGGDVMTKTHAFGSAFSYGKRYTLGGAFNVVTTERDDDGNSAGSADDASTITEAQQAELSKLIEETGSNLQKFLEVAHADGIWDVMAKDFQKLRAMLLKKKDASK